MSSRRMLRIMIIGSLVAACASPADPSPSQSSSTQGASTPGASALVTPAATARATPAAVGPSPAAGSPVAAALVHGWVGETRAVPALGPGQDRSFFTIHPDGSFEYPDGVATVLHSSASMTPSGDLQLVSTDTTGRCAVGDTGTYGWSLSPGGTRLDLSPRQDACQSRADSLTGHWTRTACKDPKDGCIGDLEAGPYATTFVDPYLAPGAAWQLHYGAITYSVPAGWANAADWAVFYVLEPSATYATDGTDSGDLSKARGISLWVQPAADVKPACGDRTSPTDRSIQSLAAFLTGRPKDLTATKPAALTIGGHAALSVDVRVAAGARSDCLALFKQVFDDNDWSFGIGGQERTRLTLVDLGEGDTVLIAIDDWDGSDFEALVTAAMPVIGTFAFHR